MNLKDEIKTNLDQHNIKFSEDSLINLASYAEQIIKFNQTLNLISKNDPEHEIIKQIGDCALLTNYYEFADESLLDLGSGGGLPGFVLKILRPTLKLYSLDSNPRKITFQERITSLLKLDNVNCIMSQLNEYHPEHKFDLITTKAFGKFGEVIKFAKTNLSSSGKLMLYLGDLIPDEINDCLGTEMKIAECHRYSLPEDLNQRQLMIIKHE